MRSLLLVIAALALAGCSSHWFEHRLRTSAGVPQLSRAEWSEITAHLSLKKGFRFVEARRASVALLEVTLADEKDPESGIGIVFSFEQGHWVEKPEFATEWVTVGTGRES